jgi:hypothetical protein
LGCADDNIVNSIHIDVYTPTHRPPHSITGYNEPLSPRAEQRQIDIRVDCSNVGVTKYNIRFVPEASYHNITVTIVVIVSGFAERTTEPVVDSFPDNTIPSIARKDGQVNVSETCGVAVTEEYIHRPAAGFSAGRASVPVGGNHHVAEAITVHVASATYHVSA